MNYTFLRSQAYQTLVFCTLLSKTRQEKLITFKFKTVTQACLCLNVKKKNGKQRLRRWVDILLLIIQFV